MNHGICVEVTGQLVGAASLLSPRGSRFNSGRRSGGMCLLSHLTGPLWVTYPGLCSSSLEQVSLPLLQKWRRYGGVQSVKYNTHMLPPATSKLWVQGRETQRTVGRQRSACAAYLFLAGSCPST